MIYLDHAATTKVAPEVFTAMQPFLQDQYGNPSSWYKLAHSAAAAIDEARQRLAEYVGTSPREIYFTGCGSESDNWAIKGTAWARRDKGRHIITSQIEHHAVLHSCQALEQDGFEVTYLPVDSTGLIAAEQVAEALRDDTILVSIMHGNNEVGTLQPVEEIGEICRERGVLFHSDMVQTLGKLPLSLAEMPVDMAAFSAHKIHGPKGVGAMYLRRGVKVRNLLDGGGQEWGKRAGTENVAGIAGFGQAIELLQQHSEQDIPRITALRDKLLEEIPKRIPHVIVTGHRCQRLPHVASFCLRYIEGEGILLSLDDADICASSGSACTSGSLEPSHVLLAMGYPHEVAHGSLRLSLGRNNTEQEIDHVLEVLPGIIARLREISPLWADAQRRGEI